MTHTYKKGIFYRTKMSPAVRILNEIFQVLDSSLLQESTVFEALKSPEDPKYESRECLYYKRSPNLRKHICTDGRTGRICKGDSGGPLFCMLNNKE